MKIEITLVVDVGDWMFDPTSPTETDWFEQEIMKPDQLYIHSNELGDQLGVIEKVTWKYQ